MNLNESKDGMIPLDLPTPQKPPEKNIPKMQQAQMDSTPISDVMPSSALDQEMMYAPPMMPQQQQQHQQMQQMMQQQPQMAAPPSKNPMNMTDEQYQALVAGVCAVIAFCEPFQKKLLGTFPQLASEAGSLTTYGLLVSGLIVAVFYYLAQKFVINR